MATHFEAENLRRGLGDTESRVLLSIYDILIKGAPLYGL